MNRNDWPFKWFGFWQYETRDGFVDIDIRDFIDPDWNSQDRAKAISYIENSPGVIATASGHHLCRICSKDMQGSSFYSDGTWLWPEHLIHYMKYHSLRLPVSFEDWIKSKEYIPPDVLDTPIERLPWPILTEQR